MVWKEGKRKKLTDPHLESASLSSLKSRNSCELTIRFCVLISPLTHAWVFPLLNCILNLLNYFATSICKHVLKVALVHWNFCTDISIYYDTSTKFITIMLKKKTNTLGLWMYTDKKKKTISWWLIEYYLIGLQTGFCLKFSEFFPCEMKNINLNQSDMMYTRWNWTHARWGWIEYCKTCKNWKYHFG